MPTAETAPTASAAELSMEQLRTELAVPPYGERPARRREIVYGALEMADRVVHAQYDLLRHAVASAVIVNVDIDVNVASRATRATEGADQAPARG